MVSHGSGTRFYHHLVLWWGPGKYFDFPPYAEDGTDVN